MGIFWRWQFVYHLVEIKRVDCLGNFLANFRINRFCDFRVDDIGKIEDVVPFLVADITPLKHAIVVSEFYVLTRRTVQAFKPFFDSTFKALLDRRLIS